MTLRTRMLSCSVAAVGALALTACGQSVSAPDTQGDGETSRSIENCGRTVTVSSEPARVVSMMPGTTDLLVRLGATDRIVAEAQTKGAPLNAELDPSHVEILSEDAPPSREVLLNVSPELVVSPTSYEFTAEQGFASIAQLGDAGAAVYVAEAGCFDRRNNAQITDLLIDIENLATLLGLEESGHALTADVTERIASIEAAVNERRQPTVAQLYIEGTTVSAIGAGLEYDIIKTAGGQNVFNPDDPEFSDFIAAVISPEELVARDPEVLVISVMNEGHEEAVRRLLREQFPDVTAVRDDRIVAVASDAVMPGTWGNIEVLEELAHFFHPDAF